MQQLKDVGLIFNRNMATQMPGRTIRSTEAVDRPLPDGKFTGHRSVIGAVRPYKQLREMTNPYAPCETNSTARADVTPGDSRVGRLVAFILIFLFCSRPFRDAVFIKYALDNGAFPPEGDSIIIGIVGSFLSTVILFPFAVALIWRGILGATRLQFVPRFGRFSIGWGIVSTSLYVFIIYLEYETQAFVLPYGYNATLIGATVAYVVGAHFWWCNCIAHGRVESDEQSVGSKVRSMALKIEG